MKKFLILCTFFLLQNRAANAQTLATEGCDIITKAVFKKAKIKICEKILDVEIADADWSRATGLMCRDDIADGKGMIFIFDEPRVLSFWMKNTRMPLSIGFFDKNKALIDTYDMQPLNETKVYASKKKSLYALETNQGWYQRNKIRAGCKFEFVTENTKKI